MLAGIQSHRCYSGRYTNIIATIIIGICVLLTVESAIQDDVEHGKALQLFNGDRSLQQALRTMTMGLCQVL